MESHSDQSSLAAAIARAVSSQESLVGPARPGRRTISSVFSSAMTVSVMWYLRSIRTGKRMPRESQCGKP